LRLLRHSGVFLSSDTSGCDIVRLETGLPGAAAASRRYFANSAFVKYASGALGLSISPTECSRANASVIVF